MQLLISVAESGPQKDDGSRNALEMFMKEKETKLPEFLKVLIVDQEFWKARVLLELILGIRKAQC